MNNIDILGLNSEHIKAIALLPKERQESSLNKFRTFMASLYHADITNNGSNKLALVNQAIDHLQKYGVKVELIPTTQGDNISTKQIAYLTDKNKRLQRELDDTKAKFEPLLKFQKDNLDYEEWRRHLSEKSEARMEYNKEFAFPQMRALKTQLEKKLFDMMCKGVVSFASMDGIPSGATLMHDLIDKKIMGQVSAYKGAPGIPNIIIDSRYHLFTFKGKSKVELRGRLFGAIDGAEIVGRRASSIERVVPILLKLKAWWKPGMSFVVFKRYGKKRNIPTLCVIDTKEADCETA